MENWVKIADAATEQAAIQRLATLRSKRNDSGDTYPLRRRQLPNKHWVIERRDVN